MPYTISSVPKAAASERASERERERERERSRQGYMDGCEERETGKGREQFVYCSEYVVASLSNNCCHGTQDRYSGSREDQTYTRVMSDFNG